MSGSKQGQLSSISKSKSLEEISQFWDTHSLSDYWDQTHEVEFEVRAKRRLRITLVPEIYNRLEAQARVQGIQPETLVNLWLAERLEELEAGC
jgi:hypothetical protein